ncbi:acyltransferase [Taibaiella chishuiensis]|uniref:Transferase family hexapeptide repeat protein n=1 Tax=Taibaiella chishuiensis TaxID=1434707 RepID=A0A2P8DB85_9BACT|nr:acyltransferase [Taibaiella chishuiensis]PSK94455.1 transferase family hexapeptide repeat protein [Taibaiella chishuiensis]
MNIFRRISIKLSVLYYSKIINKKFKFFGRNVIMVNPLRVDGPGYIALKDNVQVNYKTWLAAQPLTGMPDCLLEIGEGTVIGNFNHIYATHRVIIGKKVLTADKVYISDNLHGYEQVDIPIMDQPIKQNKTVEIGDGTWLGEHVAVMGSKIGKNCVIAANAVVTKDIPDYCVAAGIPAVIIKRYHTGKKAWLRTRKDGTFLED